MIRFLVLALLFPFSALAATLPHMPLSSLETSLAVVESAVSNVVPENLTISYRTGQHIAKAKSLCIKNIELSRRLLKRLQKHQSLAEAIQLTLVLAGLTEAVSLLSERLVDIEAPIATASTAMTWVKGLDSARESLLKATEPFHDALLQYAESADKALAH